MTKQTEAMKLALDALEKIYIAPEHEDYIKVWWPACEQAITILREALADIGNPISGQPAQPHPDDQAVDSFAATMKDKMAKAREKGRGGWETCSPEDLSRMLREHVEKGDPRDVANFCMMLWSLGAGIAEQPQQEPVSWKNAALRVGEDLCSVGPFGYYDMTAEQWLDWALSVVTVHAPPPQPATYTCGVCGVSMQMEQPAQQEPVAWRLWDEDPLGGTDHRWAYYDKSDFVDGVDPTKHFKVEPLYTTPPQRKPLTDEQIAVFRRDIVSQSGVFGSVEWCNLFARAIEAAHNITGEQK